MWMKVAQFEGCRAFLEMLPDKQTQVQDQEKCSKKATRV